VCCWWCVFGRCVCVWCVGVMYAEDLWGVEPDPGGGSMDTAGLADFTTHDRLLGCLAPCALAQSGPTPALPPSQPPFGHSRRHLVKPQLLATIDQAGAAVCLCVCVCVCVWLHRVFLIASCAFAGRPAGGVVRKHRVRARPASHHCRCHQVVANISAPAAERQLIVDARRAPRFDGSAAEPRPNTPSGACTRVCVACVGVHG
jgi:hypothetical protein